MAIKLGEEEKKRLIEVAKARTAKTIAKIKEKNTGKQGGITNTRTPEQQKYVQKLGYKPSELPSFFNERADQKANDMPPLRRIFEGTVGQGLDRLGSGFNKAYSSIYADSARVQGGDVGASAKYAIPGFSIGQFLKDYIEGATGNVDYSHNVSAIREKLDSPQFQKEVIKPLRQQTIPLEGLGIRNKAELVENPALQYATQNITGIFDPVGNAAVAGVAKGVGKLAKGATKLPEAQKVINSIRKSINSSEMAQKVGSKVVYGFGLKADELKAVENLKQGIKEADTLAGLQTQITKGKKLNPKEIAILENSANKILSPKAAKEFMGAIPEAQNATSKLTSKTKFLGKTFEKDIPKLTREKMFDQFVSGKIEEKFKNLLKPQEIINKDLADQIVKTGKIDKGRILDDYLHYAYKQGSDASKIPTVISAKGGLKIGSEKGITLNRIPDIDWAKGYLSRRGENVNQLARASEQEIKNLALLGRKEAGLITDISQVAGITTQKSAKLAVKAKGLEDIGNVLKQNGHLYDDVTTLGENAKGFVKLSDSQNYGSLAGKFVPRTIAQQLVGTIEPTASTLKEVTSIWKKMKLFMPLNSKSVFRNQVTALVQNEITGVPIYDQLKGLPTAYRDIKLGTKSFKEGLAAGLFSGTSDNIIGQVNKEAFGNTKILDKVNNIVDKLTKGNALWGKEGFMGVEQANRLNAFKYWRSQGKTAEEAVNLVNKAMYDYSKAPEIISQLGETAIPFIQFKYFAAKQLLETLATKPEKLYQIYKSKKFAEGLSASSENERDLPAWIKKNRATMVRTPIKDAEGNVTYIDAYNMLPFGDTIGGRTTVDQLVLGNPFFRTLYEVGMNKNLYFNQPIFDEKKDLPEDKTQKILNHIFAQLGPTTPLSPVSYDQQKLVSAIKKVEDTAGRENKVTDVLANMFLGLKLNSVNPNEQAKKNIKSVKSSISSWNSKIKDIQQDKNLSQREKEDKIKRIRLIQEEIRINSGYFNN